MASHSAFRSLRLSKFYIVLFLRLNYEACWLEVWKDSSVWYILHNNTFNVSFKYLKCCDKHYNDVIMSVGVSNHQPPECLLNGLFSLRSTKASKLRVTGVCEGNSPVTGEFPTQRASNADNVSIWWHHHVSSYLIPTNSQLWHLPVLKHLF